MSFLHPAAFALFASAAILVFLAFLRALTRQQAVSSLALWAGLTQSPERQRPQLHRWADPLLLLQLLALAAMIFAIAQPQRRVEQSALRGLVLILDESASMRTEDAPEVSRFSRAVERARVLLSENPASRLALIQFSSRSHVVVPPTDDPAVIERALDGLEPSWRGDGDESDLLNLVSAVGGLDSYDRLVLLTDRTPDDLPASITTERFDGGRNIGITAFTVRENPSGPGVSAFLELRNETADALEPRLTLRDETTSMTVTLAVGPEATEQYVSPFSSSRGSRFIATLSVEDDYAADNVRYFSLDRPSGLSIRWIGEESLYLRAALESVVELRNAEPSDAADLTVVVGRTLDELPPGNVLLLASDVRALYRFVDADRATSGTAEADDPAHPLLAGVEPQGIYVETVPETLFLVDAISILRVGDVPLLSLIEDHGRLVFVFSTDLRGTNLPITVDFPILIRNLLSTVTRVPGPLVHEWRAVGEPLDLASSGAVRSIRTPGGETITPESGRTLFIADEPGFYEVQAARETRAIAVNVPPGESARSLLPVDPVRPAAATPSSSQEVMRRLWPLFAWIALLLLAIEAGLYLRFDVSRRIG